MSPSERLGWALAHRRSAKVAEIVVLVAAAALVIGVGTLFVGDDVFAFQLVIWFANILMLCIIWLGLRLRGQSCAHFGLRFGVPSVRTAVVTVLLSFVVAFATLVAFMVYPVVTVMIYGQPEQADTAEYEYFQGNLPLFLFSLAAVYVGSSFGEEVTYRGFLMHRIVELGGESRRSWAVALVASSLVFGLVHSSWGVAGMVQATAVGLVFGGWYLRFRDNLWINVLAHAYMDTLLFVSVYLSEGAPAAS